jgi:hypothetical protein
VSQVPSFAQAADPALQKAIDERRVARQTKDIAAWERLTSNDTVEIHSDGRIHTRAEESAEIKAATPQPDTPDTDKKIRMFGSTAVYTYQRNPSEGPRRTTTVWVKGANGQWQCVLTQQTAVAKK